jgi:hypothetical protein
MLEVKQTRRFIWDITQKRKGIVCEVSCGGVE